MLTNLFNGNIKFINKHKKEIMIEPKISCLLKFIKSRLLFLMSKQPHGVTIKTLNKDNKNKLSILK